MIEIFNLSKLYSPNQGIKDINLKINPGEIFGILGPNGSGKSTLIKTLSTYLEPTSGFFKILGFDNRRDVFKIKKDIGVLFETSSHFEKLSGLENVLFLAKIYSQIDKKQINSLFQEFSLDEVKNEPVKNYSYGMKRKLSLIKALSHNPKVMLFDEPFSGLDYISKFVLEEKLKNLSKNGKTILIATNDVLGAETICNRVSFLFKGKLIATDTVKNFLSAFKEKEKISLILKKPMELSSLKEEIKEIKGVEEVFFEKDLIKILAQKGNLSEIISRVIKLGGKVLSLKIKEPDLGDVFLKKSGAKIK
jgi:ABC-2 type transport system ATP-binding protein